MTWSAFCSSSTDRYDWFAQLKGNDCRGTGDVLQQLDRRPHYVLAHVDVPLRRRHVLVAGKRHYQLGTDARIGELRYEPTSTAVRGGSVEAGCGIEWFISWQSVLAENGVRFCVIRSGALAWNF